MFKSALSGAQENIKYRMGVWTIFETSGFYHPEQERLFLHTSGELNLRRGVPWDAPATDCWTPLLELESFADVLNRVVKARMSKEEKSPSLGLNLIVTLSEVAAIRLLSQHLERMEKPKTAARPNWVHGSMQFPSLEQLLSQATLLQPGLVQLIPEMNLDGSTAHKIEVRICRSQWDFMILIDRHNDLLTRVELVDADKPCRQRDGFTEHEKRFNGIVRCTSNGMALFFMKAHVGRPLEKALELMVDKPWLNARVLDHLLEHPELIPERWKSEPMTSILFAGTIFQTQNSAGFSTSRGVEYLYYNGDAWTKNILFLEEDISEHYMLAVKA